MTKNLISTDEISALDELIPKDLGPQLFKNKTDLLQNKFEPKRKSNFILSVDGVDSFLVSNINEMPEFKKMFFSKSVLRCDGDLKVSFYSPITPSVTQQLAEIIYKNKKIEILLKQLDPAGTIISKLTFKKCKLVGFRISNPSYDSNQLEKVLATFSCKTVSIDL